ncbi:MAG TPA: hypothetical protein VET65_01410, partial [Candidatus Limnocylindrales bacterium]|nr:hypothetical protein [Candidatus Limnocylindrales bacterium]
MATPAVEKQAEPRSAVAAREAGARQADGAARDETTLGPDVQSVLGLQASAGNAAVTELLGGGAIEARPPAASPDLGGLNPFDALSRAGRLPPLQLLESLGGVGAAIAQAGEREHAALSAAAPRWTAQPDLPTGQPPARGPTPALEQAVVVESSPGTGAGPEGEDLAHRHAAFQHLLQQEGAMHARQAVEPLGEHAIAASGPPATAVAAMPGRSAPVTEPVTPADGDEGVSRVAEDERGPEIRSAIAGGVPALEAEQAAHTRAKADLEADAHREMTALEAENRGQRNAERAAAGTEVAGLRQAWQGEHRTALAESTAAGVAAAATARSQITEQHAEAEREATAARAQGKAQAEAAEQHGREQAAQEQKKAQGGQPGGILGAIGSAAQSVVSQVGHAVSAVMDRVRQTVTSVLQQAEHVAAQAIEKGRRMIAATIGVAAGAFEAARTRASTLLNGARDRFRTAILERVARARATVSGLMSALQHKLQRALDASGRAMAASVQRLEAGWRATLGGVRAVVEGAVQFARSAIQALGAFAPIVRDVAANPVQWVSNLAAGAQDGIRNHLWPDLQDAVRGWVEGKVDDVLGLTSAVWDALRRGGIAMKDVGQMLWDGLKAAIPPTLISILIEKIVSLLVPAAGAALLIVQSIQAAWASLSSIVKAGDAFMHFLKSVRWGNAGPLFGKALGAGAVAV